MSKYHRRFLQAFRSLPLFFPANRGELEFEAVGSDHYVYETTRVWKGGPNKLPANRPGIRWAVRLAETWDGYTTFLTGEWLPGETDGRNRTRLVWQQWVVLCKRRLYPDHKNYRDTMDNLRRMELFRYADH